MRSKVDAFRIAPWLAALLVLAGGVGGCRKAAGKTCHYAEGETPDKLPASVYCPAGWDCALHEAKCIADLCGNGRKDDGEQCDDGNLMDGDGCSSDCKSDETCGNGVWDKNLRDEAGNKKEPCDPTAPPESKSPSCTDKCELKGCGNETVDEGEQCDLGKDEYGNSRNTPDAVCRPGCQLNVCGDGYLFKDHEECERGTEWPNADKINTCAYNQKSCTVCNLCHLVAGATSYCGDSYVDGVNKEECDPGPGVTSDPTSCPYGQASCTLCSTKCKKLYLTGAYCGDGKVQSRPDKQPLEQCDDYISFYCGTCGRPTDFDANHDDRCRELSTAKATGSIVFTGSASDLVGITFSLDGFAGGPKYFEYSQGSLSNGHTAIVIYEKGSNGQWSYLSLDRVAAATVTAVEQSTTVYQGSSQSHPIDADAQNNRWNGDQTQRWGVLLTNTVPGRASSVDIVVQNDPNHRLAIAMTDSRGCGDGEPCSFGRDCVSGNCQSGLCR